MRCQAVQFSLGKGFGQRAHCPCSLSTLEYPWRNQTNHIRRPAFRVPFRGLSSFYQDEDRQLDKLLEAGYPDHCSDVILRDARPHHRILPQHLRLRL